MKIYCIFRSESTQKLINRTLVKIANFMDERLENLADVDSDSILDLYFWEDQNDCRFSFIKATKSALCFLMVALNLPDCWNKQVQGNKLE